VTDGRGLPLAVALSAGQAHESVHATRVLDAVRVPRRRPGRPRRRPAALAGDKGYSYPAIRAWLRRRGVRAVIPERADQARYRARRGHRAPAFDRVAYRRRSAIECTVGALKEARAVATRYEKLAIHYLALVQLSMIRFLVRQIERPLSHTA
jgi:transposase